MCIIIIMIYVLPSFAPSSSSSSAARALIWRSPNGCPAGGQMARWGELSWTYEIVTVIVIVIVVVIVIVIVVVIVIVIVADGEVGQVKLDLDRNATPLPDYDVA